jgi:hypothetical protein
MPETQVFDRVPNGRELVSPIGTWARVPREQAASLPVGSLPGEPAQAKAEARVSRCAVAQRQAGRREPIRPELDSDHPVGPGIEQALEDEAVHHAVAVVEESLADGAQPMRDIAPQPAMRISMRLTRKALISHNGGEMSETRSESIWAAAGTSAA